jgi:hypothetical protein
MKKMIHKAQVFKKMGSERMRLEDVLSRVSHKKMSHPKGPGRMVS